MNTRGKRFVFKILIPLVIFFVPLFLPLAHYSFDVSTLLTVVSLAFTVLIGFFFATATTNYLNLRNLLAQDDGALMTIHNLAKLFDSKAAERIAEAIDQYFIATFDFELTEYDMHS